MELDPINFFSLELSSDYDTESNSSILVITFTPRKNRFEHFHIELDTQGINKLKEFIENQYATSK